jgi:hypothetical protein
MKTTNMMKYFFFLFLFVSALPAASAQEDMAGFFVRMPDEYILQLEDAWRKDLVDLYRSGKTAALDNTMGGRTVLLKLTPDYLLLQSTSRSTVEMKFLPLVNHTHIVCVVTTVSAPAADSRVEFFTTDWKPLPADGIWEPPAAGRFLKADAPRDSEAFREAMSCLDMDLVHFRLSEDDAVLKAEYTTPNYLNGEDRAKVMPFLKEAPEVYRWKTGRFEYEN